MTINRSFTWRLRWIWGAWRKHSSWLLVMFVFTMFSSAATLAYPLVLRHVIDAVADAAKGSGGSSGVGKGVFLILALLLGARLIAAMYPAFRAWVNLIHEVDIRRNTFSKLLNKDHGFFQKFRTGDILTRLTDDLRDYPKLSWFLCSGIFRGVDALFRFLFCLVAMILLDWRVALISMAPIPLGIYFYYIFNRHLHEAFDEQQKCISKTNDALESTFSGIRIVKAFSAEEGHEKKFRTILEYRIKVQLRLAKLFALLWYADAGIAKISQGISLVVAGIFVVRGELSIGTLYAIFLYLEHLMQPLVELPGFPIIARQAFVSMDRVDEIDSYPSRQYHEESGTSLDVIDDLRFNDVSFTYSEERAVLDRVEFSVGKGEWVALVGQVGSGKSTVLKIAAGILEPDSGRVAVNGESIRCHSLSDYRRLLGYVPQEGALFSDTIVNNISLGRDIDEDSLWDILATCQIEDEIRDMDQDLESKLGHRGSLVSGGQKQRLAMARALAGEPDLLLLDDCTANLDAETEDRFWNRMEERYRHLSVLLVSHRLATVERASRVLLLKDGTIADEGTHSELMLRNKHYRRILIGGGGIVT